MLTIQFTKAHIIFLTDSNYLRVSPVDLVRVYVSGCTLYIVLHTVNGHLTYPILTFTEGFDYAHAIHTVNRYMYIASDLSASALMAIDLMEVID